MDIVHKPVMVREVLEGLAVEANGVYVDATIGSGGHAEALLRTGGGQVTVIGIDWDSQALERAAERLKEFRGWVHLVHGNFADMREIVQGLGYSEVHGVLLDLGVSSEQLEDPVRGFSFQREGPLDMRMDSSQRLTAEELLNTLDEEALERLIRVYGEEPEAARIARAIVEYRRHARLRTTSELAHLVSRAKRRDGRAGRIHPATRTFQAIRIAVNKELENLEKGLEAGISLLRRHGRIAVISFHSLEDRIVKSVFRKHAGQRVSLEGGGERWDRAEPPLRVLTRKPLRPTEAECRANPRARSARLRIAEQC